MINSMKNYCIDCGLPITDKNKGAKYDKKGIRYKCRDCYEKEPNISQETEVILAWSDICDL